MTLENACFACLGRDGEHFPTCPRVAPAYSSAAPKKLRLPCPGCHSLTTCLEAALAGQASLRTQLEAVTRERDRFLAERDEARRELDALRLQVPEIYV